MNDSKVSIIVATYNSGKTLKAALDSVLNQNYPNWECIVIDGVSVDNTIEIVKTYVEKDNRFRYISEPDKGIYDAFNKGWRMAHGEWIHYLGSDDKLTPYGINNLLREAEDTDVVYGDTIFDTGKECKRKKSLDVGSLRGCMVCHQSILMKKDVIASLGGFNLIYNIAADFDLFQHALSLNYKFHYVNTDVVIFNCRGISNDGISILKEAFMIRKSYKTDATWNLVIRFVKYYIIRKCRFMCNQ